MHLNVYYNACINTNTFYNLKNIYYCSQNVKVMPVGGVTNTNNVAKTQRQSLMGLPFQPQIIFVYSTFF